MFSIHNLVSPRGTEHLHTFVEAFSEKFPAEFLGRDGTITFTKSDSASGGRLRLRLTFGDIGYQELIRCEQIRVMALAGKLDRLVDDTVYNVWVAIIRVHLRGGF